MSASDSKVFACCVALLLLGALPCSLPAAEKPRSGGAQIRDEQRAAATGHRPWVWEVRSPRGRIWIAGCLHLGGPRDVAAFSAYLPFYRQASSVYFETMPGATGAFEVKRLIDQRGFVRDRQTLSNRISRETWGEISSVFAAQPDKLASISAMEPWMAAFSLAQDGYSHVGLSGNHSLQAYLENLAIKDRKPIGALETPKEQILAMADASLSDQEQFLRETVLSLGRLESSVQAVREAWAGGNLGPLLSSLGLTSGAPPSGMQQSLIGGRNRRWVDKIRDLAGRPANVLIVVGVEHLVAKPYALPDLLERGGFSVQRVESPLR